MQRFALIIIALCLGWVLVITPFMHIFYAFCSSEKITTPPSPQSSYSTAPAGANKIYDEELDAPSQGDRESFAKPTYIMWVLFVILVVSLMALIILRLFYGKGIMMAGGASNGKKNIIRILERQMIAPQKYLYIIEVTNKYYLIGVADNQITYLTELDSATISSNFPSGEEYPRDSAPVFQNYLATIFGKRSIKK